MQPVQEIAAKRGVGRWLPPAAALLLAAALVAPPLISLNGYHRRIADSISQAIGRPVRMSSIRLRLLPRPGFEIADFVVEEDPAFGAEPVLRSSHVTASVRLLSLWRGRLEIARIAFDEPSVNLVRNGQGRWNFDAMLSRAAQIPKAPTAEPHPGDLPRFPYIDASNARINFKSGDEKLPFSFFNADLAVWLENPGEWRIEFAAQPVRTDLSLDLANTGLVRLNGTLRRAPTLDQMPMLLHAEWSNAPLGQLSKILTGSDADWRGELNAAADITGSADHANLQLTADGQGIHRAEFAPREPLDLEVKCQALFTRADRLIDRVTCLAPTGDGHLLLTGSVRADPAKPDPALSLELNNVPVSWALDGVRLIRSGFGSSLAATGAIDGNFTYASAATRPAAAPFQLRSQAEVHGEALVNHLTIAGPALQKPLALPTLRLAMSADPPPPPRRGRGKPAPAPPSGGPRLLLEPFSVGAAPTLSEADGLPAAAPASASLPASLPASMTVGGVFDGNGFSVHLGGQSHVGELVALAREFGLLQHPAVQLGSHGTADLDLTVHGPWMLPVTDQPTAPVAFDGTVRLRNAQLTGGFLAQPMRIAAAQAVFGANQTEWTASSVSYGPVRADGALTYPTFCASPTGCVPHIALHLASLDAANAQNALLGAQRHGELVERLLDRLRSLNRGGPSWPELSGTAQISTLTIQNLMLRDVAAAFAVEGNTVQVTSCSARALDGRLHISGAMQVVGNTPQYKIEAELDHASATAMAAVFAEKWGPGSINLRTNLRFSGFAQNDLMTSAAGTFHWEWSNGGWALQESSLQEPSLREPSLRKSALPPPNGTVGRPEFATSPVSRFDLWTADGAVSNGSLHLQKSRILNSGTATPLTGTISFRRELSLSGSETANPVRITGTLQRPLMETTTSSAANSAAR